MSQMWMVFVVGLIASAFVVARFAGVKNNVYKAFAHVFVGFVLGWAVSASSPEDFYLWIVFGGLCAAEVTAAVRDRLRRRA